MYSAFDLKNSRYFHIGRNSKRYNDCFEAIKNLIPPISLEEWEDEPKSEFLDFFNVRIDSHKKTKEIKPNSI